MARVHVTQEEANGDRILATYDPADIVPLATPYPQATLTAGNSGANVTSYPIPLPDNLVTGDFLGLTVVKDGPDVETWPSSPATWRSLPATSVVDVLRFEAKWHKVSGTEGWGGTGNSITLTSAGAEGWAHALAYIPAGTYWSSLDAVTSNDAADIGRGTSAAPDPPLLDPTQWAAENTLWIASYGWDGDVSHTGYPAGYTTDQITSRWAHADGVGVAMATRERNVSFEDPGAAALSGSTAWLALTCAIRPKTTDATTKEASLLAVNDVLASGGVVIAVHTAEGDA